MTNKTLQMGDELYRYLLGVSLREPPLLARLREETSRMNERAMQIAPEQGQFMAMLIRLIGARRCIELGVFTGYSTLATAMALPDDGYVLACDVSEEWTRIAGRYWAAAGVHRKIDLQLAPALTTLRGRLDAGEAGTYDFAFIDADKENYGAYFELCLELLRRGGLIVVDNVLWSGRVIRPEDSDSETAAIRDFNESLRADERVDLSMLPIADGLTLARKR